MKYVGIGNNKYPGTPEGLKAMQNDIPYVDYDTAQKILEAAVKED